MCKELGHELPGKFRLNYNCLSGHIEQNFRDKQLTIHSNTKRVAPLETPLLAAQKGSAHHFVVLSNKPNTRNEGDFSTEGNAQKCM